MKMNNNLKFLFDDEFRTQFYLEHKKNLNLVKTIDIYKIEKKSFINILLTEKITFLEAFTKDKNIVDVLIENVTNENYLSVLNNVKKRIEQGRMFMILLECMFDTIEENIVKMIDESWSDVIRADMLAKTDRILHMFEECGISPNNPEMIKFRETSKISDETVYKLLGTTIKMEEVFKELVKYEFLTYTHRDHIREIQALTTNVRSKIPLGIDKPNSVEIFDIADSVTVSYGSFGNCFLTPSKKLIRSLDCSFIITELPILRFLCDNHPNLVKFQIGEDILIIDFERMIPLKRLISSNYIDIPLNFIFMWAVDILSVISYLNDFEIYGSLLESDVICITHSLDIKITLSRKEIVPKFKSNLYEFGIIFMQMISRLPPVKKVTEMDKIRFKYQNVPIFAIRDETVKRSIYSILNEKYNPPKKEVYDIDYAATIEQTAEILLNHYDVSIDNVKYIKMILNRCRTEKPMSIIAALTLLCHQVGGDFRMRKTVECIDEIIRMKNDIAMLDI